VPLGEVIALGRDQCDLARPESLAGIVRDAKPDIVINAAAYTAVDKAEQDEALATTVNGTSAGVLAEQSRRAGALLIHYSTDYVFDGGKSTPYTEDDAPAPINAYGRSKLAGETAIRQTTGAYIILRAGWIYAARGNNFVRTIIRLAGERDELQIVTDQVGSPTWARDIAMGTAAIIAAAAGERRDGRFASGLFHIPASGTANWYEFAVAILRDAAACGLLAGARQPRVHTISSENFKRPAERPKNSRLAGDRLRTRFGVILPDWKDALARCLKEMKSCAATTEM
jgi:dTDP-4-dehydrorhamnose reductase